MSASFAPWSETSRLEARSTILGVRSWLPCHASDSIGAIYATAGVTETAAPPMRARGSLCAPPPALRTGSSDARRDRLAKSCAETADELLAPMEGLDPIPTRRRARMVRRLTEHPTISTRARTLLRAALEWGTCGSLIPSNFHGGSRRRALSVICSLLLLKRRTVNLRPSI